MIPIVTSLGPIPINSFGLFMVLGILATWQRIYYDLEFHGEDPALAEKIVFWGALGGFVGARLLFVVTNIELLIQDPIATLFGGAGFVYWGGFLLGGAAVLWATRKEGFSPLRCADYCAIGLSLGYAVGRVGCQLSGDGDYGIQSSLPWAVSYELGVYPTPPGILSHPTPVYETLMALLICYLLLAIKKRGLARFEGQLFGLYLVLASLARFAVENVRIEPIAYAGFTQAQLISLLILPLGAFLAVRRKSGQII